MNKPLIPEMAALFLTYGEKSGLAVLADLAEDEHFVRGILKWRFEPLDFKDHIGERKLAMEALSVALERLEDGDLDVGAIYALGLSGCQDLLSRLCEIYEEVGSESEVALACLQALRASGSWSNRIERVIMDSLDRPNEFRAVALKALQPDRMSSDALSHFWNKVRASHLGLPVSFLLSDKTRVNAVEALWQSGQHKESLLRIYGPYYLEWLAALESEEVEAFLYEEAFSDWGFLRADQQIYAIRGLCKLKPGIAFQAARYQLEMAPAKEKRKFPRLLMDIDPMNGSRVLRSQLLDTENNILIRAIGESLEDTGHLEQLVLWLRDSDERLRHKACLAAVGLSWNEELILALEKAMHDPAWKVRDVAVSVLESVEREGMVTDLVEKLVNETARPRQWALLDSVLEICNPRVSTGLPWFLRIRDRLSYAMWLCAARTIESQRKKLIELVWYLPDSGG